MWKPEIYQSSDKDDYVPQISEVPAITSERLIREYNVVRKPVKIYLNSDPASQISLTQHLSQMMIQRLLMQEMCPEERINLNQNTYLVL